MTLTALFTDSRTTDLSAADDLFGRFVGEWRVSNALFDEHDATWRHSELTWAFSRVLEGRGIQDLISDANGAAVGTTVRTWDARAGWRVVWFCPRAAEHVVLTARAEADRIVLDGVQADGRRVRWEFSGMRDDTFAWDGWCSNDDGTTWWHEQHMDAERQHGSVRGESSRVR